MLAGQVARLLSVALFLAAFTMSNNSSGGISDAPAAIIGIAQLICLAACGAAVIAALAGMFSKKNKSALARYVLSIAGNAVCIGAVSYFELYRFWGC